jgi:outer membrane protein assembly factor BamB
MSGNPQTPENVDWEWDDTPSSRAKGQVVIENETDHGFVFNASEPEKPLELKRVGVNGEPVWVRSLPDIEANSASLLANAGRLYGALFSDSATGGQVVALDAISGETLWMARIEGIGPKMHSKYGNRIQLRFINNWLVIFGDESGGKYIEVFDSKNGQRLSNRIIRP